MPDPISVNWWQSVNSLRGNKRSPIPTERRP